MYTFYFEKLEVWKNSRSLVKDIYTVTTGFPKEEIYGITNQIRRASISIPANIAEGFSRDTNREKSRFVNIAYSTAWEVLNFLILSHDLDMIKEEEYIHLRKKIEHITNQLNALQKALKQNQ